MKYDQIYQDVSRWYGVPVEDGIGVKTGIFEAFGIELPNTDVAPVKGKYVIFDKGKGSAVIDKIKNPPTPDHEVEAGDDDGDSDQETGEAVQQEDDSGEKEEEDDEVTVVEPVNVNASVNSKSTKIG